MRLSLRLVVQHPQQRGVTPVMLRRHQGFVGRDMCGLKRFEDIHLQIKLFRQLLLQWTQMLRIADQRHDSDRFFPDLILSRDDGPAYFAGQRACGSIGRQADRTNEDSLTSNQHGQVGLVGQHFDQQPALRVLIAPTEERCRGKRAENQPMRGPVKSGALALEIVQHLRRQRSC